MTTDEFIKFAKESFKTHAAFKQFNIKEIKLPGYTGDKIEIEVELKEVLQINNMISEKNYNLNNAKQEYQIT